MNHKITFSLIIILILLTSCSSGNKPSPVSEKTSSQGESYPNPYGEPYPAASPLPESGEDITQATIVVNMPEKGKSYMLVETPNPEQNPVVIQRVLENEDGTEVITVANISSKSQDIRDYVLMVEETGEQYVLGVELGAGETVSIYNGPKDKVPSDAKYWLSAPAVNTVNSSMLILNGAGRVVWTFVTPPQNNP